MRAMEEGKAGAETFLKELVWRDFAYHLSITRRISSIATGARNGTPFPGTRMTRMRPRSRLEAGRTGIRFVDAAMREMYVTGRMHNRARMLVASYLTKHLMSHWKIGLDWFEDCLVDWDPASNAMGWQWSAGSGPDATPYFRVFNPETQAEKFDKARALPPPLGGGAVQRPARDALSYFDAIPRSWGMSPGDPIPIRAGGRRGRRGASARWRPMKIAGSEPRGCGR
jgi:deoxyribodipyrimidine photo-lyase